MILKLKVVALGFLLNVWASQLSFYESSRRMGHLVQIHEDLYAMILLFREAHGQFCSI
jgi:hypothetical protein